MWVWIGLLVSIISTIGMTGSVKSKVVRLQGDLDRDGHLDPVTVSFERPDQHGGLHHFKVQIGRAVYEGKGEHLHGEATIVDIDSTDQSLEIAVPQWGPSDDDAVYFLRYSKGRIWLIGIVPGAELSIDGSGTVRTSCRGRLLCTWFYPCVYRWSQEAQVLVEEPQVFKPMHVEVTLLRDLSLCSEPLQWRSSTSVKAGTRATIDLTDDRRWCRIHTAQGEGGWFSVEGGWVQGVDAREMFEDLPIAD